MSAANYTKRSAWQTAVGFWTDARLGALLLACGLGIGSLTLFSGSFGDEADNLAAGRLIAEGFELYRGIFSHHFPFAYYWVALFFWLFGPSVLIARLSLLVFQLFAFGAAMWVSRLELPIGVTVLAWNLVSVFYYGNMVLYNTFEGIALASIIFITYAIATQPTAPDWKQCVAVGILAAIAVLSDPVAIFPASITVVALAFSKAHLRAPLLVVVVAGCCGLLYLGYLLITGGFAVFYASAVTFNTEIYSKYYNTNPMRAYDVLDELRHILFVFEPSRWTNPNSVAPVMRYSATDRWILSGMIYRIGVLLATALLMMRGRLLLAGFVYIYIAALLVRSEVFFRAIPFVLGALAVMSLLAAARWAPRGPVLERRLQLRRLAMVADIAGRVVAIALLSVLMYRGALMIRERWDKLSYRANFEAHIKAADNVTRLTCGQPAMLGYYPGNPYVYFFSGQRPVSKYLFMYPWVAEIGTDDVVRALSAPEHPLAVVFLDTQGEVWGRKNSIYLGPLKSYLQRNYDQVGERFYRSPSLERVCPL